MCRLLSKEACLYAGADWLGSSISQQAVRGQFHKQMQPLAVCRILPAKGKGWGAGVRVVGGGRGGI